MSSVGVASGPVERERQVDSDALRVLLAPLPRPVRFLIVGSCGLLTDVGFFTLLFACSMHPLIARMFSLALATLVTWRLNRHLTFTQSGRHQADEAMRYVAVTGIAQGIGYAIFAVLALTSLSRMPQLAILIGAAAVTAISYNGHRLIAFMPRKVCAAKI
jgi:putative flippase GtrA